MADKDPAEPGLGDLTEVELLGLVIRGDRAALSALYDRFVRQVFSLALRMVENPSLAEEITQDVFMTVWTRGSTYRSDRGPFSSWLLSVTHNRCIDELRKRRRRAKLSTIDIDEMRVDPSSGGDVVLDAVFARLDRETIVEALNRLPSLQKQVIVMAYFQGLTQSEISEVLGSPLGTVKTRMRLGLHKMRDLLAVERLADDDAL
ncbi:MAG: sigma-70 family RNA polymerase sigma factor [Dehalococcoidia bacterium]